MEESGGKTDLGRRADLGLKHRVRWVRMAGIIEACFSTGYLIFGFLFGLGVATLNSFLLENSRL